MVVAQLVRITNNTSRTFRVRSGDPFYTPQVDGVPCVDATFEVPPGFDQACDGLVVPWLWTTNEGLVVTEEEPRTKDSTSMVRCVVAPLEPKEDLEDRDWLQLLSEAWEPIAKERWMPAGTKHIMMGTIGAAVEIHLTFRDARGFTRGTPAQLHEVLRFDRAVASAQPGDVLLNVYDLAPAVTLPNAVLSNTLVTVAGAFHAAVEVYGEEWSFYRTPNPTSCGVCKSLRPRQHPVHVYRQTILLGRTELKDREVRYLIRSTMAPKWVGGDYDLLERNCIHFCDELLLALGVKPVPGWVTCLHETGSSLLRWPWPLSIFFGSSDAPPSAPPPRPTDTETGNPEALLRYQSTATTTTDDDKLSDTQSTCGGRSTSATGLTPSGSATPLTPWLRLPASVDSIRFSPRS